MKEPRPMQTSAKARNASIRWLAVVLIVWVIGLLAAYYQVHLHELTRSLSALLALPGLLVELAAAVPAALMRGAPDLLTVALLMLSAGAIGRLMLRRLDLTPLSAAERAAFAPLVGLGLLSTVALLLGLVGLFQPLILWAVVGLALIIGLRDAGRWLRDLGAALRDLRPRSGWGWLLAILAGVLLLLALLMALAPPTAWDGLTYHLVAPQRYLEQGRITGHADNPYLGFSQLVETLYGVAFGLFGRDTSAAVLHGGFGLLGLLAVMGLVQRSAGTRRATLSAWLAAAILLSAFSLWWQFGIPYVDLAVMAYSALVLSALTIWRRTQRPGWLIAVGVVCGLLLSTKYTSGALLIAVLVLLLIRAPRHFIQNALLVGVPAVIVFAPWMLRGLLLYQNPVYPFVFGGLEWDAVRTTALSTAGQGIFTRGEGWHLPLLPVTATLFGVHKATEYDFSAGIWLLTAPLLLPLAWRHLSAEARTLARDAALLLVPLLLFWIGMAIISRVGAQVRLVMMALPIAAVAGSLALMGLRSTYRDVRWLLTGAFTLTLVLTGLLALDEVHRSDALDYHRSGDRTTYLATQLGVHYAAMQQLATLPAGSHIRTLWDPLGYTCPPHLTCNADLLFDHWARPLKNGSTPAEIFQWWRQTDDYILVFDAGYAAWLASDPHFATENALFPQHHPDWLRPIWTDDIAYTLYTWRDDLPGD